MEIILDSREEEIDEILIEDTSFLLKLVVLDVFLSHLLLDLRVVIFLTEQIRNFSDSQNVIDIFNKPFIDNLIVTEQEHSTLSFVSCIF